MSAELLKTIRQAYFGMLPFNQWKDAFWNWKLELIVPGGGGVQWGHFREYFRWPDQIRTEFEFKDGTIVNLFDGKQGWDGAGKPIDADRFQLAIRMRHLIHDLISGKIKVVHHNENEGMYKLDFDSGDEPEVRFNPKSGLLLSYEGPSKAMGRPNLSRFEWSDYKVENGIPVPCKHNLLLNGVVFQRRTLEEFNMNPNVEDRLFNP